MERRRIAALEAFAEVLPGEVSGTQAERHIDEKDHAPAHRIDQPTAEDGAHRARERANRRPGADRSSACLTAKFAAEYREAVGHQQGGSQTLQPASRQ